MSDFTGTSRFQVVRRIGAGGMGVVYEALDTATGGRVAIKTLRDIDGHNLYRLKNEFRALQDVQHPNLVSLGDLIEHGGDWFFTMELVTGTDFLTHVRGGDPGAAATIDGALVGADTLEGHEPGLPFDEARLRDALAQLASGLIALHAAGKVHRDIKPANIRVSPSGRVVVLDFGLVSDRADPRRSMDDRLAGTIAYMAPEQAASRPVGPEADWYAVGTLLYEALTGRLPFTGSSLEILMDKQRLEPPMPRAFVPRVPRDLELLCMDLLAFDPAARPPPAELRKRLGLAHAGDARLDSTTSSRRDQPLFGRDEAMAVLADAFTTARGGQAVTVCVTGESGIGKSALIHRFAERIAREQGAVVLAGRCYERESVPYKGFDGVIDALSRHLRRLPAAEVRKLVPEEAGLLTRVFPVLDRVEALGQAPRPHEGPIDPQQLRNRAFATIRALFGALARACPLIVIIDDLHWSDADSLLLLRTLLEGDTAPPLLLLVTMRNRADGEDPAAQLPTGVRPVALAALPPATAAELARDLLARLGVDDAALAGRIADEARGNPMFIDALARQAASGGRTALDGALPLDDAIRARAGQLPEPAIQLLELVVVAETQLPVDVLRKATALATIDVDRSLGQLGIAMLVRRSRAAGVDVVEPFHDRVRDAFDSALAPEVRTAHHRRLAAALEGLGLDRQHPEVMARHLAAAGERNRAGEYARDAAERAVRGVAYDRAAEMYRLALELGPFVGEQRRDLLIARAEALVNAGRAAESVDVFLAAVEGADPARRTLCLMRAATLALYTGAVERSFEIMTTLLGDLDIHFPRTPGAVLRALVGQRVRLRLRGMRWTPRHASELAPSELGRVDALFQLSMALALVDNLRSALLQTRATRLALQLGEPTRVTRVLLLEGSFYAAQNARGVTRGARLVEQAAKVAANADDPLLNVQIEQHQAIQAYLAGDFRKAVDLSEMAQDQLQREYVNTQVFDILNLSRLFHCLALRELGALRQLGNRVDQFTRSARQRGEIHLDTTLRRLCSIVWLSRDQPDEAEWNVNDSPWPPPAGVYHLQHAAITEAIHDIAVYRGEVRGLPDEVWRRHEAALSSHWMRIGSFRVRAAWLLGRMGLSMVDAGEPGAGLRDTARSVRQLRREGIVHADVCAGLLSAGLAAARGNDAAAVASLEQVAALADEHGLVLAATMARRRRGQLVGGDEGQAAIAAADALLRAEGVVRPDRLADVCAPGFRRRGV